MCPVNYSFSKYAIGLLSLFFLQISTVRSQSPTRFKIRKENNTFVFFQKGIANDSISKKNGGEFYLVVNDSLKKYLLIHVENGQLLSTSNDSLVKLIYMNKLRYECFYTDVTKKYSAQPSKKIIWKFETLINGVSVYPENKIRIKIFDGRYDKLLLENVFYYSD